MPSGQHQGFSRVVSHTAATPKRTAATSVGLMPRRAVPSPAEVEAHEDAARGLRVEVRDPCRLERARRVLVEELVAVAARPDAAVVEDVQHADGEARLALLDPALERHAGARVEAEEIGRAKAVVSRVVEMRRGDVATGGGERQPPHGRVLDGGVRDEAGSEQRRDIREVAARARDPVSLGVVDVVELRPAVDAAPVRARAQPEAELGTGPPQKVELEAAPVALVHVAPEREADLRELARLGDLVAELHREGGELER